MLVFVLNKDGKSLMPCKPRKARILLKEGKARVIQHTPFTIQLLYGSSGYKQPVTLGIDAGYENIGFSAVSEKTELISGEVMADIVLLSSLPVLSINSIGLILIASHIRSRSIPDGKILDLL
ncbi:RRXRR domain-containing protein [Desulfobacterales bacterium HSG16]|nr:RRXRR domain-containing protein [Desulfobacterales bacterium HSG16]